ncbi:uncharacterized [Tachysurus ichikawai]
MSNKATVIILEPQELSKRTDSISPRAYSPPGEVKSAAMLISVQFELPHHGSPVRLTLSSPSALKAASISQRRGTKARAQACDFQHPGPLPAPTLGPFRVKKAPTGCRKGQERTKERKSMGKPSSQR